ncbi:hypothetical protein [Paenibacillus sp. FSL M7-1046]|uniref:hypothetical protein n=1 Tax=Paenibacillus sp. FSL M7-1046 TaxID=2975315 RepID=UPI0030FC8694
MSEIALQHAKYLALIDEGFQVCKIVLSKEGIEMDSTNFYWSFRRGEEEIIVKPSPSLGSFIIERKTKMVNDTITIDVLTKDYSKRLRASDLLFYVGEGFGLEEYIDKDTNMSQSQIERFFQISRVFLEYLGENTDSLLMGMNPRQLDAGVCADVLKEFLNPVLVKLKDDSKVVQYILSLADDYKKNINDDEKLEFILERLDLLAKNYGLN